MHRFVNQRSLKKPTDCKSLSALVLTFRTDTHKEESQVEVRKRRPSEDQLDRIVNKLYLQYEFPEDIVARGPDAEEESCRMDCSEERSVEPAATLGDELGNSGRDVGSCFRALDIAEAAENGCQP